jgi:hypothetical protein
MKVFYSQNIAGNIHEAVRWATEADLADHVFQFVPLNQGLSSIVILQLELSSYVYYVYELKRLTARTSLDSLAKKYDLLGDET